jgi:hypothetical protein
LALFFGLLIRRWNVRRRNANAVRRFIRSYIYPEISLSLFDSFLGLFLGLQTALKSLILISSKSIGTTIAIGPWRGTARFRSKLDSQFMTENDENRPLFAT